MPPIWHLSLDSLHPISTAIRNRLGTTDRRLLSRALHVSPTTFPDAPFLLRTNIAHNARSYTNPSQEHKDPLPGLEFQSSGGRAATPSNQPPWRFVLSIRGIDPWVDHALVELPQGRTTSRLTQLDEDLVKNVGREGPRALPTSQSYSERRQRLTDSHPGRQSLRGTENVGDTGMNSRTRQQGELSSLRQSIHQNGGAHGKREEQFFSPDLFTEEPEKEFVADHVQPGVTESRDWLGISYFEAMQSLDAEQTLAATEDPAIPDVISKKMSSRDDTEDSLQGGSTVTKAMQPKMPEDSGRQEAAQSSERDYVQDSAGKGLEQQNGHPQLELAKQQQTAPSAQQESLVAALFPEMTSALDAETKALEQQKEAPENGEGLVAAIFPEMIPPSETEKQNAVEEDPNGLLSMLFPELSAKQVASDDGVHLPQPPSGPRLDLNKKPVCGESGGQTKSKSEAKLFNSLFPEDICEHEKQLPQATLERKAAVTTAQKPAQKPERRVTTEWRSVPGQQRKAVQNGGGANQEADHSMNYHDAVSKNLVEELFPEEYKKQSKEDVAPRKFDVPKMRLDVAAGPNMRHYIGSGEIENPPQDTTCIVNLQAVSPRLTEEDFRGLLPPSKYIEGWSSQYIKTIPIRDPITLDRKDSYYILFSNKNGALQFKRRLQDLHNLLFRHAPTSMLSARTHSIIDQATGEDVSAALKLYTLGPANQRGNVFAAIQREPWPLELARLVHNGGYPQVMDRAPGVAAKVLLHFEGTQPTKWEIVDAIRADGHDRGVPWDIPGGRNGRPTVVDGVVQLSTARRDDAYADSASLMRKLPPRWLISFRTKAEAHRFVRRWHRRPFPWQPKDYADYGEDMPTTKAEVLW